MPVNQGLFSSASAEWETPQWLFDELDREFDFTLDPCATPDNAKCIRYFTKAINGLAQPWHGNVVFVNPPYGHQIAQWVAKAIREASQGVTVVMLVPARTDTRWWHDHIMTGSEIRFIKGCLYFTDQDGNTGRAPFPSAVVVFRPCDEWHERVPSGPAISTLTKEQ